MPNKPAPKAALGPSLASPTPAQRYFKNQWQDMNAPLGGGSGYQFGGAPSVSAPQAPKMAQKGPLGGGMNTMQGGGGGGYTTMNNPLTMDGGGQGGGKADSGGGGGQQGTGMPDWGAMGGAPAGDGSGYEQHVSQGQGGSGNVNQDKAATDALAKLLGIEKDPPGSVNPKSPFAYPTQPQYGPAPNPAQSYIDEINRLQGQVGETYNTGWIDNALKMQLADMANQQAGGEMRINENFGAAGLGGSGFQASDIAGSQLDYAMGRQKAISESERAKQEAIRAGLAAELSATQGAAGLDMQGQQLGMDKFNQKVETAQSVKGYGLNGMQSDLAYDPQYGKDYDAYAYSLAANPNLDVGQMLQMLADFTDKWIADKGVGPFKKV